MPKKSDKKTEPLRTRFDYDENPKKNPQAVMVKAVPPMDLPKKPMDYDDLGPKVVDMPLPKMDYDSPLPLQAPQPVAPSINPPVPPQVLPPMGPPPAELPIAPKPMLPGVMVCPNCDEGAEIVEEDAADLLECPKCGFEVYSSLLDKTAGQDWDKRLKEFLKKQDEKGLPATGSPSEKSPVSPKQINNLFWRNNGTQVGNEKARLFEEVLGDLNKKESKYENALKFFKEFKKKMTYQTQEEADKDTKKLIDLAVTPNRELTPMIDFVKALLGTESINTMESIAKKINGSKKQTLSEMIHEAAQKLKN